MEKAQILKKLRKITGISAIKLTSSGDSAIEAAMMIAKSLGHGRIIIPDQGGWFSYRKIPVKLNMEYEEIKTDRGLILPEELKKYSSTAFIFPTFAGYFAEQNPSKIYSICKKNKIFLIEDITAGIGWKKSKADIAVSSFSQWKPLNLGYGGLIGAREGRNLASEEGFLEKNPFEKEDLFEQFRDKIDSIGKRCKFFFSLQKKVKKELNNFEIIHRRYKGINVVAKYSNEEEKEKLINYCKKNNYEFVNCPNYIKVNEPAISIELKRLEEK